MTYKFLIYATLIWKFFDAFELWCWKRLLRVPRTTRRSNPSILKEINPEHSLEGLVLKFWYFGHLMRRADSLEKTLGKVEGKRRGRQRMRYLGQHHRLNGHELRKLQEIVKGWETWHAAVPEITKSRTQFSDWTSTTIWKSIWYF